MMAIWHDTVEQIRRRREYDIHAAIVQNVELLCPVYMETHEISKEEMDEWEFHKQGGKARFGPYHFPHQLRESGRYHCAQLPLEMKDNILTSEQVSLMWAQVDLALKNLDVFMEETKNGPGARTQKAWLNYAGPQLVHETFHEV